MMSILQEGQILYFDPFYFKDGGPSKPKYFIILKLIENISVLASLPTRSDHIPSYHGTPHGCIELPAVNFNCYHFHAEKEICDNGFAFPLPTFAYGAQIDEYESRLIQEIYPNEGVNFHTIGTLTKLEYQALLNCFKKSKSVKMKFKRLL